MSKSTIVGTDTVYAALITRCNANFTELYNMLTGVAAPVLGGTITGTYTLGGTLTISVQAWQDFTPTSGWTADTQCSYMKDPMGFVHLKGYAHQTGSPATFYSALPSGYRPAQSSIFLVDRINSTGATTNITISTAGVITAGASGANDQIILDGITFKAA
jgi:hypothetical protein